nr:catalase [Bradyrhizobium mercantei]
MFEPRVLLCTSSQEAASPASIVDALKAAAGESPTERSSFARGCCVRGTYVPSDRAKEITRSRSFTEASRVLARFSVGGNPTLADTDRPVLRRFSFRLGSDGHRSELLTQNAPVHFARTLDQMLALLKAAIPGQNGKPNAKRIKAFSAANPETLRQAQCLAAQPLRWSFADTTYWAVHAFPATNSRDETRFIKFKVAPVSGDGTLTDDDAAIVPSDILNDELGLRIATRDVRFSVIALLDRPGDPVMDLTIRWPEEDEREAVRLGTIVITGVEANDEIILEPGNLAEGIGYPPDEMFAARCVAYAISRAKRR